jgi:exoribonuclease R
MDTLTQIDLKLNPSKFSLFTNDVFVIQENGNPKIIHSTVAQTENIPATLILSANKTYGRYKNGKTLYKCVPDDTRLPIFLVPYEFKKIGFSKVFSNHYVTIKFIEWTDKHPIATLTNTIGPVDSLDSFYEYQLYCKSLNVSIQKFTKDAQNAVKLQPHEDLVKSICNKYPQIENRCNTSFNVITIDPKGSLDYDDGFSIKKLNDSQCLLSIYISNVSIWLDSLNLWDSFSKRIATIYLPDRKRPMLPTILSDCLCSLQEGVLRFAFVLDIIVNIHTGEIIETTYKNALIKVNKNYRYEEPELLCNSDFNFLLEVSSKMANTYKYMNVVRNSHDVVCYLMILMNCLTAKELVNYHTGIFRSTIINKDVIVPDELPEDVQRFIKIWNSSTSQYIDINAETVKMIRHDMLDMDAYIHITSPIRRLVDLLNIIQYQESSGIIQLSNNALNFKTKWLQELDYINITMRAIRKVQCDCNLLDACVNNPSILENLYDGYCFDKIIRNDGLYQFIVFLPELKLATRITLRDDLSNYDVRKYKLYIFNDEDRFKKKIRLQLM